jgi:hypothetical protein
MFYIYPKNADNRNRAIEYQKEEALQALNQANMSSNAHTKYLIIAKSQTIADNSYNRKHDFILIT